VRFGQNTLQATLTVCVTLVIGFVATGFASSAYHRKRDALGVQHYQAGLALEHRGQLEPALEEYRQALIFSPDKTEYRLSLATALLEANRLEEAQTHLEELLQENPTSGPINLLLGRLAVRQRKLQQALEFYQRGVYEYWPESQLWRRRDARWELANLLSESGDRGGFIGELMQLYTNLPAGHIPDRLRVGFLLLNNGATSEASRIFQDLSKIAPQNAQVQRGMGQIRFSNGEYVSARHDFQRALRIDPNDRESSELLTLTNDVIDLDPALPYITSAEQTRRSRNLLGRVVKSLEACSPLPEASQRVADAAKLVSSTNRDTDAAFAMQQAAAELWSHRNKFCAKSVPLDRALDTVFARIGHE